jgi:head-tail adaptor
MDIDAGELNKRIRFVELISYPCASGYRVPDRCTVYECAARWRQESSSEVAQRDGDFGVTQGTFVIRYKAGLSRKLLIEYAGNDWEILYIDGYDDSKQWLKVHVRRVSQKGDIT